MCQYFIFFKYILTVCHVPKITMVRVYSNINYIRYKTAVFFVYRKAFPKVRLMELTPYSNSSAVSTGDTIYT